MRLSSRAGAAEAQGAADTKHGGRRVRAAAAEGKWGAERRWQERWGRRGPYRVRLVEHVGVSPAMVGASKMP